MRSTRSLALEPARHEVRVGDSVTVRVRDDWRRPVAGAVVEMGTVRRRTDETGRCELPIRAPGFWTVVAARAPEERVEYEPASTTVRAVPTPATPRSLRALRP